MVVVAWKEVVAWKTFCFCCIGNCLRLPRNIRLLRRNSRHHRLYLGKVIVIVGILFIHMSSSYLL